MDADGEGAFGICAICDLGREGRFGGGIRVSRDPDAPPCGHEACATEARAVTEMLFIGIKNYITGIRAFVCGRGTADDGGELHWMG
jgi:hypothetical protein